MRQVIVISIIFFALLNLGCNSEKKITKYYQVNKDDMIGMKVLAQDFIEGYNFKSASIRASSDESIGIRLLVLGEGPYKGTGAYFNRNTLELMPFFDYNKVCDSCTLEEEEKYLSLIKSKNLKEILQLFMKMKPDAIKITSEGVFFALGMPIKSQNKSEVEGAIFLPFNDNFNKAMVVKQIEKENTYLYETVVE